MKSERLKWTKKLSKKKLLEQAQNNSEKILAELRRIRHIALPVVSLQDGALQITIRPRFIRDYLSINFEAALPTQEESIRILHEQLTKNGMEESKIDNIVQDFKNNAESYYQHLRDQYTQKSQAIFTKRKEQVIYFTFLSLFNVMHSLTMAEIAEDDIEKYGDPKKLAHLADLPLEIAEKISANMYQLPRISWAEKSLAIQEKWTKDFFNIKHGGNRYSKFTEWKNPVTRLEFLSECLILEDMFTKVFTAGKKLKSQNRFEVLRNKFGKEYPFLLDVVLREICEMIDKNQTSKKLIDEIVFGLVVAFRKTHITTSYARRLFFEAQKEFLNKGEITLDLNEEEINNILNLMKRNRTKK